MQDLITNWNGFAQTWFDRLGTVVWQSALLTAFVASAVAILLRRSSPAVRYWIWQILAIKLLVMPFWAWSLPWRAPFLGESTIASSLPVNTGDSERSGDIGSTLSQMEHAPSRARQKAVFDVRPELGRFPDKRGSRENILSEPSRNAEDHTGKTLAAEISEGHSEPSVATTTAELATPIWRRVTWQGWLLLIWGSLVLVRLVRLLAQHRRLTRLLADAVPADGALAHHVAATAERMGIRRAPSALIVGANCSPFVCGIRQPKLILPFGLPEKLTPAELNQVLLHELAHLRRRDLVWSWIGEVARIVYFFHPVAHWIDYQARLERELACDQLAMAVSGHGPNEYAAMLVQVVTHASEPSVFRTAASVGREGE